MEHELLMRVLEKDDELGSQNGFSIGNLDACMAMITIFADRLMERYSVDS